MIDLDKNPSGESLYNIGAVMRATGVPVTTLRAWERRYGFPRASRTAGGHRLYSEKDIFLLRWVKAQVDAGLATHLAIRAAQKMETEVGTPLRDVAAPPRSEAGLAPLPALREGLTRALYNNTLGGADQILGEMLAFFTPEELTLNIIGPILNQIGEDWESGKITVAVEHLASSYLRQRLLMWMISGPRAYSTTNPIILACAPGEWHDGSLLMLGVLLRRRGLPVSYLGQNVPFADLAKFIEQIHPSAVVLVAMREEPARELAEWPKWIKSSGDGPLMGFGGRAFVVAPGLKEQVKGIYLGDTIQQGMERLLELMTHLTQKYSVH